MWRERALFIMEGIEDPYLMASLARLEWLGDMDVDQTQTFLEMLLLILRDAMMIQEAAAFFFIMKMNASESLRFLLHLLYLLSRNPSLKRSVFTLGSIRASIHG